MIVMVKASIMDGDGDGDGDGRSHTWKTLIEKSSIKKLRSAMVMADCSKPKEMAMASE